MIVESLDGIVYRLETLETKSTLLHQEVYSVATRQSDLKRALIQQQQQQQQPSSPSVSVGGTVGGADDLTHRLMSIELNMESLASAYVESLDSALSRQTTAFLGVVEELLKDPHGGLQRAKAAASGSPAPSPSVSKRASMRLSMPVVPDMGIKEGLSRLAHSLSRSGSSLSVVEDQEEEVPGVPGSVAK
ncbi:hypothetical protein BCR33DRAFT_728410 [Rhizoclosmatium globosum]|uniref:Uncharacterized protein n=1 Tax=Rhizoclosmatium globosum TaxID=329046 RepID=A0A1Y2AKX5_9FUNG|nr:hypothetical protein BCR33DRAFT_728410 [Rhizoclosmatium globosum]|eukprot:ORY22887.1 hypothetical protein BCR33DRAFT_728410 [Rhizoclosmatium globosum]